MVAKRYRLTTPHLAPMVINQQLSERMEGSPMSDNDYTDHIPGKAMGSAPMSDNDYTDDIPGKAASLADELGRRLKGDIHDEVIAPLQNVLVTVREVYEDALHDAVTEQDRVVEMLKDRLLSQQGAKAELHGEITRLEGQLNEAVELAEAVLEEKSISDEKKQIALMIADEAEKKFYPSNAIGLQGQLREAIDLAEAALDEKNLSDEKKQIALAIADEAEKKFHQANSINRSLNERLENYRRELDAAVVLAETLLREKNRLEGRLNRLIANS